MPDHDGFTVEELLKLPRLAGLTLSPDGERLVTSASRPSRDVKKMLSALYELDPRGASAPRRLTRSREGESGARFAPDGSLVFLSPRRDPEADEDDPRGERNALWALPAEGGEARLVTGPPGGVESFAVARGSGTVAFATGMFPGTSGLEEDAAREKARKDAGVEAQLFTDYPIRFWDHDLGPRERHLRLLEDPQKERSEGKDLVPSPGRSLDLATFDLTPDGSKLVTGRRRETDALLRRDMTLVCVDTRSGKQRVLADDAADYGSPACSPDGRHVVAVRSARSTPDAPGDHTLFLFDLESGEGRDLLPGFDRWPEDPVWSPDSRFVYFTADDDGRLPAYRVEVSTGEVERLTDEGSFGDLCPSPDGKTLYALRSSILEPPHPIALDLKSGEVRRLKSFPELEELSLPSRLERIEVRRDGRRIPSWLVLPEGSPEGGPAPLAVFVHGGPLNSWNTWHWRWNPHVFTSEGWAVLLPDPALSVGYGLSSIERGWGRWGSVVYEDVMAAVEDAASREGIDGERAVLLGGSFGGYMANWVAGHTDRFRAIVTHASVWDLESFHGTTDLGTFWEREFGDPYEDPSRYRENNPRAHVKSITTPMLVIHGARDYRVPVSEALTLWTDLKRHGVPAAFLYFPDENHWILKPNDVRLWYRTVLGFIAHHALGEGWKPPELLA